MVGTGAETGEGGADRKPPSVSFLVSLLSLMSSRGLSSVKGPGASLVTETLVQVLLTATLFGF